MNVLLAFEHEGPFVSQLKSSLAPGRGGGYRDRNSVALSEARTSLKVGTAFRGKSFNISDASGDASGSPGYISLDPITIFLFKHSFRY